MAGVSLSGLTSGLDTESIVTQLMQIEARPKTLLERQQRFVEGRRTALEDVASKLRALSAAVGDLKSAATWVGVQRIDSSNPSAIAARTTGTGAPTGSFGVTVHQLARAEQRTYDWRATSGFAINGVDVDLSSATTVDEAAARINETANAPVYAGTVNGDLVLTAKALGTAITLTGPDSLAEDADPAKQHPARNTRYSIDGAPQTETTATVVKPGGLPGVELTLKAVTDGPVTVQVGALAPDTEKVKEKIKAFVTAYNAAHDLVSAKLTEKKKTKASTDADFALGALRGDPVLSGLSSRLRQVIQDVDTTTAIDSFREIGVGVARASTSGTITAESLAGKLTLDETALSSALASDPAAVKNLLGYNLDDGVAQRLEKVLNPITKASSGYLARSRTATDAEVEGIRDRIESWTTRLATREARLRAQFTAMETALTRSKDTAGWVSAQVGSMTRAS